MRHFSQILIFVIIAALLSGCGSKRESAEEIPQSEFDGDNYVTYTSPPPRTIPLDSVKHQSPKEYPKPPPKYLNLSFVVAGPDSCRVIIDLHLTPSKLARHVIDSVMAPGRHKITWNTQGKDRSKLAENIYYYQFDICGKKSTKKLKYRTGDFGLI